MAKEAWTVFFEIESAGAQNPVNWKEKDIVVEGKEKNSGLIAAEQTKSIKEGNILNTTIAGNKIFTNATKPLQNNIIQRAYFTTIEAESAAEAAKALRTFLGQGTEMTKVLAAPWGATALTETEGQP